MYERRHCFVVCRITPLLRTQIANITHPPMRETILTCAQKPTRVSLICRTEQKKTKKWKREKLKGKKNPVCPYAQKYLLPALELQQLKFRH